jgi:hypothetical protein
MDKQRYHYSVSMMSRVLEVSRAGYYGWKKRLSSARHQRREAVKSLVREPSIALHLAGRCFIVHLPLAFSYI